MSQNDAPSSTGEKTSLVQPSAQGLDWGTLASQLGWSAPTETRLPDARADQTQVTPAPGSQTDLAQPATHPGKQVDHTDGRDEKRLPVSLALSKSNDSSDQLLYDIGRGAVYAGTGFLYQMRGDLDLGFSKYGPKSGLAFGAGIALADTVIDKKFFGDTPRGVPSVIADAGSLAIMATPQPPLFKAAEMIGLHVLGKYGDKWFG